MGSDPLSPFGSSHENSLFRCFAHGLKMCMSCALDIIVKLFSQSLFYELVIQLQVDICILDTILMLVEFGPESGALATVGEFVICVTMTWRHLHFKWRNGLQKQQQWIDSKWKLRKSLQHVLSDVLSNENKRVCDGKGIVAKKTAVLMWLISCVMIGQNGNEKFVGAVSVWNKIATDLLE